MRNLYLQIQITTSLKLKCVICRELKHGIPITDENDNRLGESTKAAQQAISQVVVSRILMASPGMGMNINILL